MPNFIDFSLLKTGYHIDPGALGSFAKIIIEGVGIIGVGIIVFALVLKAIVLPFDIYQRVKMRKQTLIMRQMQPELEKLQKQYANDKTMYNQKMMELYKKNGYSMFGACLPMIISMVILIIAFQGFRTYSTAANLDMYVRLSAAYNHALNEYVVEGDDDIELEWQEGITVTVDGISYYMVPTDPNEENPIQYVLVQSEEANRCIVYQYPFGSPKDKEYKIDRDKFDVLLETMPEAKEAIEKAIDQAVERAVEQAKENETFDETTEAKARKTAEEDAYINYFVKIGATAVQEEYKSHNSGFLWVKNVWYPDVSYQHPIQNYKSFSSAFGSSTLKFDDGTVVKKNLSAVMNETQYNRLISELGSEMKTANGYYILIILSIGLMVLSQFISMRSQKESNKYQTVDGSGARTQKIMLIMMPLIYAVFAFMYSAAFSIYMVMSSFISICITLLSNLILGRIFHKKEVAAIKEKNTRMPAWMKQQESRKDKKGRK